MKTIRDRINYIRQLNDLSFDRLAEIAGDISGAGIRKAIERDAVKVIYLNHIADKLGINRTWLIDGEGEMQKSQPILDLAEEPSISYTPKANILHVPAPAEAGFLGGVVDPVHNSDLFPYYIPGFRGLGYSFEVKGNSMLDTLRPGEFVITDRMPVQRTKYVRNDYIYVIASTDEILIKRVNKHSKDNFIWLVSDNENYVIIEYELNEHTKLYQGRRTIQWNLAKKMRYD